MSWFDRLHLPFGKKTQDETSTVPGAEDSATAAAEPGMPPIVQLESPPLPEPPLEVVSPAPVPEPESVTLPPPAAEATHVPPPVVEEAEAQVVPPPVVEAPGAQVVPPPAVEAPEARPVPPHVLDEPAVRPVPSQMVVEPEARPIPPPVEEAVARPVPPPVFDEPIARPLPSPAVDEPVARPAPAPVVAEPETRPVPPSAIDELVVRAPETVAQTPAAVTPEIAVEPQAVTAEPQTVAAQTQEVVTKKGFWAKTWEVLNAPIPGTPSFGMDRELIGQIAERLSTTRRVLVDKVRSLVKGRTKVDEDLLEELEELLLESDMGVNVADGALAFMRAEAKAGRLDPEGVTEALATYLKGKLGPTDPLTFQKGTLTVVLLVGVNGTGKTTTLGKLAHRCVLQGYNVVVAAADTFRAAAIDQLEVWAERAGVPVVRHAEGGDAAAVVYDAIASAKAKKADVVLVDTAGRLHNKANLMAELAKIRRIVDREAPDAPKEVLLVLDATTGQNGLRQAEVFGQAVKLTGVVLSKLDGTAKGGVIFAIKDILNLPVRLVGLGEGIEDLRDFDRDVFVDALFAEKVEAEAGT